MTYLDISFGYKNVQRFCMVAVFLLLSLSAASQTTRYVTLTGAGTMNGSSWANASSNLQATINASASNDAVWVAAGTYKPTLGPFGVVPSDPRDKTFYVKDGVKIYGGFAGTETLLSERNITANITTLSGDFNGNDAVSGSGSTLSITGNTENAYHVVLASAAAVGGLGVTVDGFSIIGGNASLNTVVLGVNGNNVARDNGGGIFTTNGTNTLTNNLIYNNAAANGGGIFTRNGLNSTISNNTIYNNATSINGGGIFTTNGTDMVTNNTIYGNKTALRGGGVHVAGINAINTFANNTFYNNNGTSGGAFYTTDANNTLINNTFYNNNANNGAGIFTVEGTNTISNNILWGSGSSIADYYYVNGTNGNTFTNNLLQLAASNYPTDASWNYGIGTAASGNIFAQNPLFVDATDIDGADDIHRTADDGLRLQSSSPCINTGNNTGVTATDITGAARIQNTTVDMGAYEWFYSCPTVPTLYVDASIAASGNGETWATAYKTLDEALAVAHCCAIIDTIKVATGTYLPTKKPYNGCTEMTTANARDLTFHLPDGLVLWGGYPAGGGVRNSTTNVTTLSGDFNGDDVVTGSGSTLSFTGNGENAYHVVMASAPTSGGIGVTIDGFSIIGGNANGSSFITVNGNNVARESGGAIITLRGTNALTNNLIYNNAAINGGGIYASGTNTITNNTISGNRAIGNSNIGGGGGIYAFGGTNTTLAYNTISGNRSGGEGGGGIYAAGMNSITNNTLLGNSVTFVANSGRGGGGGIYASSGTTTITNNTLSGNSAIHGDGSGGGGGGISIDQGTHTLTNNTLSGNSGNTGGGIFTNGGINTISNNILWGNQQGSSSTVAGADYYAMSAQTNNNIFTNNLLQLAASNYPTDASLNYGIGTAASGNIFAQDPLFVNAADIDGADNIHRTADDGLRLQIGSPCINTGNNTGVTATDITGAARIQNTTVDIGAYEGGVIVCPTVPTLYVDASIATSGNGQSWAAAYKTLDEALAVAHCCSIIDTIKVATGTYLPTKKPYNGCTEMATADPRDLTFHLPDGLVLWGGYPAGGGVRNNLTNITTLSGDFNGDDVVTGTGATLSITNNTENAYHVVVASTPIGGTGVTVDGFAITGGNANGTSNLTVSGNAIGSDAGGAIFSTNGNIILTNNTLSANSTSGKGGAVFLFSGINLLTNNTLFDNKADYGGGIYTSFSTNTLTNNTLSGNSARYGGGILSQGSNNTFKNNTLSANSATDYGGGIYAYQGTDTVTNCIFWDNLRQGSSTGVGADIYISYANTVTYCLTQAGSTYSTGTGIINNQDPLFVNATDIDGADNIHRTADDGLKLSCASPAYNAGTSTGAPTTDITGTTRPQLGAVDMGAYENVLPTIAITGTTTGCGSLSLSATELPGVTYCWQNTVITPQTWQTVGNVGFSVGSASHQSLAFNSSTPYVAYSDGGNSGKATVMKFDGTNWVVVGNAGFSAGTAYYQSLVFNGSTPYVAYSDDANSGKSTVMKFDGTNWVLVGNAGFSAGTATYTSLVFNGSTPYVAYRDLGNGGKSTVMKFDGTNWVIVGNAGFSAGQVSHPSLAFNGSTPYVAYADVANGYKTTVMKFDGTNWVVVGNVGFSAGQATDQSLAFNGSTPYVAYADVANGYKTTVMEFDGTNWVTVGNAGFSAGTADYTSLAFNGSTPYVAYQDGANGNKSTVMKFDGTNWVTVGNAGFSAGAAYYQSLAFYGSTPYVAYRDGGNGFKTTVMKFDNNCIGSSSSLTVSSSDTYTVIVTDANGCSATASTTVEVPTALTVSAVATDALCNGGTGSVVVSASGGTSPYTGEGTFSELAGTYTYTITDNNGCSATASATVSEPTALVVSTVATDAACNGDNGSVVVSASGGTSPYTGEGTFSELAGTYTYTITDDNGCSATASATVGQAGSLVASAVATDAGCNGGTGSVVVSASGGTSPYTGEGTFTEVAGTYTYTVTDDNGCSATASATVGQAGSLVVSAVATDAGCNGGTGSVVVSASGGTSPYNGEGTFTEVAGTYTYTVTDDNGCSATASTTVAEPSALTVSAVATDALCNGGTGSVVVSASGGTSPYTGEGTFSELAGTYTYTITDNNGCSATASATVSEPTALVVSTVATDAACNGDNGSVVVSASGGTSPYTGEGTFSELAGTYTYTITDDNGCSATASATVSEPTQLTASAVATDALCNGGSGSVVVSASGGTAPYTGEGTFSELAGTYTYTITDNNGCSATASATVSEPTALVVSTVATDALCNGDNGSVVVSASGGTSPYTGEGTFSELAGTYTYTITDDNGCSATASATVSEPTQLTASAVATDALCNGDNGSVVVSASGGTSPYTGEGTFSELAGTYTYTITDDNGCSATASATVGQAGSLVAATLTSGSGCASVTLTAEPYNGTDYTYAWSAGATGSGTDNTATITTADYYTVTVTEVATGCTATAERYGFVYPAAVLFLTSNSPQTCGGVIITAYDYDPNITAAPTARQAKGKEKDKNEEGTAQNRGGGTYYDFGDGFGTANTYIVNSSGTYTVTIQNGYGCTTSATIEVVVTPGTAEAFAAPATFCAGEDIALTMTTDIPLNASAPYTMNPNAGVSFNDISSTGTAIGIAEGLEDDTEHSITLPFSFNYNGTAYTEISISSNGAIAFGNYTYIDYYNDPLPTDITEDGDGAYAAIAAFWDDLDIDTDGPSVIHTQQVGNTFIIQWNMSHNNIEDSADGLYENIVFQMVLDATTGAITFVYNDVNFGNTDNAYLDAGGDATIGLSLSPTSALQYSYNTASLTDGQSIQFTPFVPTLSYSWEGPNGFTSTDEAPTVTGTTAASAGVYTVTVSNANGCSATASTTVVQNTLVVSTVATDAACNGGNGSVVVSASGGTSPYTGEGTFSEVAGTYTYTVTDDNGCSATASATVSEPTQLTASAVATDALCNGGSGSVVVSASGGTAPYTGEGTFSETATGTYTYTVTDANGCSATASQAVTVNPLPVVAITGATTGCGSVSLSATELPGATYCWQNTVTPQIWQNVGNAGFSAGVAVYQSLAFNGSTPYVAYRDGGNSGKATVMKFDGTNWVVVGNVGFSAGQAYYTSLAFNGSTPYVAYQDDANGNKATVMKFDGTNWVLVGNAGFSAGGVYDIGLAFNGSTPYVAYSDNANGNKSTVMKFDGTNWVTVGNAGFSAGAATYQSLAFNGSTPYMAYADIANGNKSTVMKFDGTNWVLVGNAGFSAGAATYQSLAFNGSTPYVAYLDGGNGNKSTVMKFDGTNWVVVGNAGFSAGPTIYTKLAFNGGTPYVAYSDGANSGKATVMKFDGTNWVTVGNAGFSAGAATYQSLAFNGSMPYVAYLDGGNGNKSTVMKFDNNCIGSSSSLSVSNSDTYTVIVTDANGCSATASTTVEVPSALTVSAVATDAACNGGTASVVVSASGGTSPYTGEGTFTETAGTYTYTVTDDNGCSATASATISEPSALIVSAVATDAACNGGAGSVDVSATGGTSPYTGTGTFTETAGTYTYTVTDDNGCSATASATVSQPTQLTASAIATDAACNGGAGSVDVSATGGTSPYTGTGTFNETAGTYTYTVTDANGCSATASTTVSQPTQLTASAIATDAACNGGAGSVVVSANGGTSPYTGTGTFTETAGTYTYTVTDDNGCSATASATVGQPSVLSASSMVSSVTCHSGSNGSINVTTTGGKTPYTYVWSNGATTEDLSGVSTGTYVVTVTDDNGCSTVTLSANVSQPAAFNTFASVTNAGCAQNDGAINLTVSGATPEYSYIWSNGNTIQDPSGLSAGTYAVTISDTNGCSTTSSASITALPLPSISTAATSCFAGSGIITVTAAGTGLTYSIGGASQNSNVFNNVANGNYTVVVTNSSGCTASKNVTVSCLPCSIPVATNNSPVCVGANIGLNVNPNLSNGVTASYAWSGPAGSSTQKNPVIANATLAKAGVYTVTVTYSNGCVATASTTVIVNAKPTVTIAASGPLSFCAGGSVTLTAGGGNAYNWSNGSTTAFTTIAISGTYTVTVTNAAGCTATAKRTIVVNALPNVSANLSCGISSATITVNATGNPLFQYSIGGAFQGSNVFNNVANGTYVVTVTNVNGCSRTTSIVVNCVYCSATAASVTATASCAGEPIVATASGYNTATGYAFYYLLADANGNIVAVNTTGTFATTSLTIGATYTVYGYNVKTSALVGGPNPPAVGTNVGSITGSCFALSNASATVVIPNLITIANSSSEGASNGTSPFTYNTTTIEITGGTTPYNFDWDIEGYVRYDIAYTQTGATITIYYSNDASWSVTTTDGNECTTGGAVFSNLPGNVNTLLDIDSYAVTPTNLSNDGSINLAASGGDLSCGTYQYQWTGPDTWTGSYATTGNGAYTLSGLPSGWYSVIITDCAGNTAEGWYWVPEGSRGRTKAVETLSVMPNPFADKAIVEFSVNVSGNTTVNVYSIDGKQVATLYNANTQAGETYQVTLDGANLPSGMYFVKMTNANGETMLQKVMINR